MYSSFLDAEQHGSRHNELVPSICSSTLLAFLKVSSHKDSQLWLCCKPVCFAGTMLWTSPRLYCVLLGIFYFSKVCKPVKVKGRLSVLYSSRKTTFHDGYFFRPTIEVHLHSNSCFLCKLCLQLSVLTFCRRLLTFEGNQRIKRFGFRCK